MLWLDKLPPSLGGPGGGGDDDGPASDGSGGGGHAPSSRDMSTSSSGGDAAAPNRHSFNSSSLGGGGSSDDAAAAAADHRYLSGSISERTLGRRPVFYLRGEAMVGRITRHRIQTLASVLGVSGKVHIDITRRRMEEGHDRYRYGCSSRSSYGANHKSF